MEVIAEHSIDIEMEQFRGELDRRLCEALRNNGLYQHGRIMKAFDEVADWVVEKYLEVWEAKEDIWT